MLEDDNEAQGVPNNTAINNKGPRTRRRQTAGSTTRQYSGICQQRKAKQHPGTQQSREDSGLILQDHLNQIFDISETFVGLDDFASMVVEGYPGVHVEQEKQALHYALTGYKAVCKIQLVSFAIT